MIDIEGVSKRIAKKAVDVLNEYSMIDSDTPGAVSEEEEQFCREQIEPIIIAELTEALRPVPGSWLWACEQMKAGKRVRHSTMADGGALWVDPNGFIDWMPDNEDDQPEDYGDNFLFDWQDFSRTDWQLATPSTSESTAPGPRQGPQG